MLGQSELHVFGLDFWTVKHYVWNDVMVWFDKNETFGFVAE